MKIHKYSELRGEWWIRDGEPLYADGDVGDKNHEAYVIEHVQSNYVDSEFDKGEYIDWEGFENKVLQEKLSELEQGQEVNINKLLVEALTEIGMTEEEISIARGIGDAREYGISHLGWKRVKENYVETQNLTSKDLSEIARGLGEAYEFSDEEDLIFTIEVRSNNTLYEDVPLSVIEIGDPIKLAQYRNRYARRKDWYRLAKINK